MTGLSTGFAISVYMLSAVLVWGGIGYLIDRWMGIEGAFTAVGAVVGAGAGIYLVYLRYGREHDEKR